MNQDIPFAFSYDDVLLVPQYSEINSRSEVNLTTQITPRIRLRLPLISINMSDVTGVEMAIKLGKLGGLALLPRFISIQEEADMVYKAKKENVLVGAAIGIRDGFLDRAEALVKAGVDVLTIDVAHGALLKTINATKEIKEKFGKSVDIISGVTATKEATEELFKAGADSVRVGVGPGTICITRIVTGVGVPQITAVMQASIAARKYKKTVLCDGGTRNSGDIVKGLASGAAAVIIGSQFAGCDEAPGKVVVKDGSKYKTYNASTSLREKKSHIQRNIHQNGDYIKHIEGVESFVTYKGSLEGVIGKMEANLRAGFSYCGASNIHELHENARFVRISSAGMSESMPHGVITQN